MEKWSRIKYMPCLPLGDNRSRVTGCKKHIALSRKAAQEGIVLLKNNNTLPLKKGTKVAIFGTAQIDYYEYEKKTKITQKKIGRRLMTA